MELQKIAGEAETKNLPFIIISIGICLVLFWIGLKKFTPTEAEGISPFIVHSPFVSWTYFLFGKRGASAFIGAFEWLTAIGIIAGNFKAAVGMVASIVAMLIFLVTSSFFLSTPGMVVTTDGIWGPTPTGEFLLKDVTILGASIYLFTYFGRRLRGGGGRRVQ